MSVTISAHKNVKEGWYLQRDDNKARVSIDGVQAWATKKELETALRGRKKKLAKDFTVTDLKPVGRPRVYTEEEYKERRLQQSREYTARRKAADPERVAAEAKKYRERTPEKQKQYRDKSYASRKERLKNDPEYREKFNAYQREYQARKRAEKKAGEAA